MKKTIISASWILALGWGLMSSALAQNAPAPAASAAAPAALAAAAAPAPAPEVTCFESRKGASEVVKRDLKPGHPNVKCSTRTGAVLWWGDPFDGTVPMGDMPLMEKIPAGKAVVKPRSDKLPLLAACGTGCHNGVIPPKLPTSKKPVPIPTMEGMMPDAKNFQHGRGGIWCLDCHHTTQRNKLVDNFGDPVSIEQPQLLCGKCHGDKLRDWRDGIHGKRIGEWASTGKKRWFTCTECHNPHNVQDGARNRGFIQIAPEAPPQLPRGMIDAKHELRHGVAH